MNGGFSHSCLAPEGHHLHSRYTWVMALLRNVGTTLEMIKWEHSVFALPFALTGAMLAAAGWPAWHKVFWIVVCMVTARSAAMAFNRWADARLDAANPRTAARAIPAGMLSRRFVAGFTMYVAGFCSGRRAS